MSWVCLYLSIITSEKSPLCKLGSSKIHKLQLLFFFCSFFTLSLLVFRSPSLFGQLRSAFHGFTSCGMYCWPGWAWRENSDLYLKIEQQQHNQGVAYVFRSQRKNKEENRRLQSFQTRVSRSIILWILWVPLVRYPFYFEIFGITGLDNIRYTKLFLESHSPLSTERGHDNDGSTKSLIGDNSCSPSFLREQ